MGTILILRLGDIIMKVIILCVPLLLPCQPMLYQTHVRYKRIWSTSYQRKPPSIIPLALKETESVRMEKDLAALERLQVPLPVVFCKDTLMVLLFLHVCRKSSVLPGTAMTASAGP